MSSAEDGSPVPVFITATDEAAEALTDFAREMQAQERQAGGLMIGVLGKARGYALRLAVVLEYLPWIWNGDRREPAVISRDAMERVRWSRKFGQMVKLIPTGLRTGYGQGNAQAAHG